MGDCERKRWRTGSVLSLRAREMGESEHERWSNERHGRFDRDEREETHEEEIVIEKPNLKLIQEDVVL
ncbi:hypothetical protein NL676_028703 [Syzygium grande]|nr:hypothetical protein NL676_028703 [Syzygium grande]